MYVLFSTESDRAGFAARLVAERSILIESIIIYECSRSCRSFVSGHASVAESVPASVTIRSRVHSIDLLRGTVARRPDRPTASQR
jgi:hypothetical protein